MMYFGEVEEFKENRIRPEMKMRGREDKSLYRLGFEGHWGGGCALICDNHIHREKKRGEMQFSQTL